MRSRTTRRGVALTELTLGAAQLGNLYRATSDDEAAGAVRASWHAGIRSFDTAPHYGLGLSERRLGRLLSHNSRDAYVLSTKVGRVLEPADAYGRTDDEGFDVPADHVRRWDFTRDGVLRSVEDSLRRTGLDRFDILYLHDPDDPSHFETASTEGIAALIELREQGVVRAVGAGMNAASPLAKIIHRADVDFVMLAGRLTLLDQSALAELVPLAADREVAIVAAGVYNSGLLGTPRPAPGAKFDYGAADADLVRRAHALADICESHGIDLPTAALAYPLRFAPVASVAIGARTQAQVAQNVERHLTHVPDALWLELEQQGHIPEFHL